MHISFKLAIMYLQEAGVLLLLVVVVEEVYVCVWEGGPPECVYT